MAIEPARIRKVIINTKQGTVTEVGERQPSKKSRGFTAFDAVVGLGLVLLAAGFLGKILFNRRAE